ncbi:hypothetical protein [Nocardiopsis sp. NPDC055824]
MRHRVQIRPVPVPDWVLHRPTCSCGWTGDIVRTHVLADEQVFEHLDEHPDSSAAQAALFDL